MKTLLLVALFLAFTIPSTVLLVDEGVVGLVHLVQREPWALQILVDLVIACSVFVGWMWRDAPALGAWDPTKAARMELAGDAWTATIAVGPEAELAFKFLHRLSLIHI